MLPTDDTVLTAQPQERVVKVCPFTSVRVHGKQMLQIKIYPRILQSQANIKIKRYIEKNLLKRPIFVSTAT